MFDPKDLSRPYNITIDTEWCVCSFDPVDFDDDFTEYIIYKVDYTGGEPKMFWHKTIDKYCKPVSDPSEDPKWSWTPSMIAGQYGNRFVYVTKDEMFLECL